MKVQPVEQLHGTNLKTEAIAKFAIDLYNAACQSDENVLYSPTSINIALAMVYMGARNKTAKQIKKAMHLSNMNDEEMFAHFKFTLQQLMEKSDDYELITACKIFIEQTHSLLQTFVSDQKDYFGQDPMNMNFLNDSGKARKMINYWLEEKTNHKITNLLPDGSVSPLTKLVLANAVYFKGKWEQQFDQLATTHGDFHSSNGNTVQVKMMHNTGDFFIGYSENLDSQILELPYIGNKVSMFIILPSRVALNDLRHKLTFQHLLQPRNTFNMSKHLVQVAIPKFKLEESLNLTEVLGCIGISDVFNESVADLSGMDDAKKLHVSAAVHKSYVELNEEGTEAAAATGIIVAASGSIHPTRQFFANRPFLFYIHHNVSESLLFVGQLSRPE